MPPPTQKQVLALDELLERVHADHGLTQEQVQQRKDIVNRVEDFIHKQLPGQWFFNQFLETEEKIYQGVHVEIQGQNKYIACLLPELPGYLTFCCLSFTALLVKQGTLY